MKKNIVIIHFNTPELTEAAILSLRKHGGEDYSVFILDNSDRRPFTKRMKGVKVFNNRKGQIINFQAELEKFPERDERVGCSQGCVFGSDIHMMSVQKMFELVPDGFVLLDSDVLIKKSIDWMFMPEYHACGCILRDSARQKPRLMPMLLWINVPKCVADGARFFAPEMTWALYPYDDARNWYDTGGPLYADIRRLKPQCRGKRMSLDELRAHIEHFGGGSWRKNDIEEQKKWLSQHKHLWE